MTNPRRLVGKRFWLSSDKHASNVYEARRVRHVKDGPEADVGCLPVNWQTGELHDNVRLSWFRARDVADALRVQGEPDPRYLITTPRHNPRVEAAITRKGCPVCGDPDFKPNSHCSGRGHLPEIW